MHYLKLKRKNHRFTFEESSDNSINILYYFLSDDVNSDAAGFQKYLNDPSELYISSNFCSLEKDGENIIIGCCFDEEISQEEYYKNALTVSTKSLYDLLTEWDKAWKEKPDEII